MTGELAMEIRVVGELSDIHGSSPDVDEQVIRAVRAVLALAPSVEDIERAERLLTSMTDGALQAGADASVADDDGQIFWMEQGITREADRDQRLRALRTVREHLT
ncbi:hypothetical protein NY547_11145 [Cnuibacter physcomitrellae]|uniref:hypothetical protein n=1 Tax=Cnuibacter physcomitrellae TaxID=1619308 RepID=UPI002175C04F|nr:hypothetical protein [Cnuibacter physcomitrellae]MCS5497792.1 hypothetical protein [Cnuibacter physcomitrellae]